MNTASCTNSILPDTCQLVNLHVYKDNRKSDSRVTGTGRRGWIFLPPSQQISACCKLVFVYFSTSVTTYNRGSSLDIYSLPVV